MPDFYTRLNALSPNKRTLLERRYRSIVDQARGETDKSGATDQSGKRLVVYIVPVAEQTPTADDLRNFLRERLPDYMVPSAFAFLDALPLTATGKVDRHALPTPEQTRNTVEPRTDIEHLLATIWRETLQLETIGVHDNFFELGGNSIQAAITMNKLQTAIGEYVHVATLFKAPTIAALAVYLYEHHPNAVSGSLPDNTAPDEETTLLTAQSSTADEAQLMEMLNQLSDEDVRKLLDKMTAEEQ